MRDFSNLEEIKRIDPQDTVGSTNMIPQQMEAAWEEVNTVTAPQEYRNIKNIVFCGMGASIYGALVLKALLGREMPFPSEIVTDYFLPDYVDDQTLVVLTSYSGTTEEVLSCAEEAKAKKAKMVVLTKGGPLAEFAKDNNLPAYIFDGKLNPAGTPRLGNGYTILGLIGLLNKIGVIDIEDKELENAIIRLKENFEDLRKQAVEDVALFYDKIPIVFAAEHLSGNAQILRNQFNETSKVFSACYLVPDLNHHLMEGLQFPKGSKLQFIVLNSPNYSEKIRRRMELTIDVVKQNGHDVYEFMTSGSTVYDDFLEALQYGSFLTLYLALVYDQNPAINPWVDYFKGELSKSA
jgi:glucose/mannose-6-phosphate isomerase